MDRVKRILSIVGAVVLMGSIAGGVYFMETHYATAEDLKANYKMDRVHQLRSDIRWYQDQMNYVMSRCGVRDPGKLPAYAYESYERDRKNKEQAEAELKTALER